MNITQSVQKWGNGTGIRLPQKVMQAAHFTINEPLNITIKGKSVILTPVKETEKIRLEDLLSGVTPQSVGGEHSWGSKVGAEIL